MYIDPNSGGILFQTICVSIIVLIGIGFFVRKIFSRPSRNLSNTKNEKVSHPQLNWEVVNITLTNKTEEFIGEDRRVIDNSQSNISVTRRFTVSREWSQTYKVESEKAQNKTGGINAKVVDLLGAQYSATSALRKNFAFTEGEKKTYTEDVTLQIPANKKVNVLIQWKNIWQNGLVVLRSQQNTEVEVPFRVLESINFDQSQVDVA